MKYIAIAMLLACSGVDYSAESTASQAAPDVTPTGLHLVGPESLQATICVSDSFIGDARPELSSTSPDVAWVSWPTGACDADGGCLGMIGRTGQDCWVKLVHRSQHGGVNMLSGVVK